MVLESLLGLFVNLQLYLVAQVLHLDYILLLRLILILV